MFSAVKITFKLLRSDGKYVETGFLPENREVRDCFVKNLVAEIYVLFWWKFG